MKLTENVVEVIVFIEEEYNIEGFLDKTLSMNLSDDRFEEVILEYTNMLIKEIADTLNIEFEIAQTLYDDYITKDILLLI